MRNYKRMYEALKKEFDQYKKESVKWSVEDFTGMELDGWSITKEQAQDALEDMIHHHDANNGIHWQTIEYYIEQHGTKVEIGKELWRKEHEEV